MKNSIILSGCNGVMGKVIASCISGRDDCVITAGIDINTTKTNNFDVFSSPEDITADADVIIDFSHPLALSPLLKMAIRRKLPIVVCTTGLSDELINALKKASEIIPVFHSGNMSLGINLMINLAKKAAEILGGEFDIEIIEKHHNQKIDAPSGTTVMLADAINKTLGNRYSYEYDRHSKGEKRSKNEIGIHSVRGGTIVGEHEVLFAGPDEIFTISHSARSKDVFATGAVNAALFISKKPAGLYDMSDLLA